MPNGKALAGKMQEGPLGNKIITNQSFKGFAGVPQKTPESPVHILTPPHKEGYCPKNGAYPLRSLDIIFNVHIFSSDS